MNEPKYRWYSGKYDSMKQRRVLDEERDENKLYFHYIRSLRMEMLLCGTVVVTDSQWYDGTFFTKLTDRETEFYHLKVLLNDQALKEKIQVPLLQVKRRNNYIAKIFGRDFVFSSLPGDTTTKGSLSQLATEFGKDHGELIQANPTFGFYFTELKKTVEDTGMQVSVDEFEAHTRWLDEMPQDVYSTWDDIKGIPIAFNWKLKSGKTRRELLKEKFLDKWERGAKQGDKITLRTNAQNLWKLLQNEYPDRGSIKTLVDHSKDIGKRWHADAFDKFMNEFNVIYNRGLAVQHQCDLYDIADISENLVKSRNIDIVPARFPQKAFMQVGDMTWQDFGELLRNDAIIERRRKWLREYALSLRTTTPDAKKRAEESLDNLMLILKNEFPNYDTNWKGAYNAEDDTFLVGGSSDLNKLRDNEISFYFDTDGRDEVKRYGISGAYNELDTDLGTIGVHDDRVINTLLS